MILFTFDFEKSGTYSDSLQKVVCYQELPLNNYYKSSTTLYFVGPRVPYSSMLILFYEHLMELQSLQYESRSIELHVFKHKFDLGEEYLPLPNKRELIYIEGVLLPGNENT